MELFEKLRLTGILPVLNLKNSDTAAEVADALRAGGLPALEVTLRSPAAISCIEKIRAACPNILLGAGTVLTVEQADAAIAAGAQYLVSPGLDPELVHYCMEKGYPVMPGVVSPSEVQRAFAMGLRHLKFFPAEAAGGPAVLKLISSAFPQLDFVVTGGITTENLRGYLALPCVAGVGGSFMAPSALIETNSFSEITARCRDAVQRMLELHIVRIGIPTGNDPADRETAEMFAQLLNLPLLQHGSSCFSGSRIEVLKEPGRGRRGHIAIGTCDIRRAAAWMEAQGMALDWKSAEVLPDGTLQRVFLQQEAAGFAFQLLRC